MKSKKPSKKSIPQYEYMAEMSFVEIAERLNISTQAVEETYYRAIFKLVKLVNQDK